VPALSDAIEFLKNLEKEQLNNPTNVNVFHCMGGKGRTGTITSMHLLHSGICKTAPVNQLYPLKFDQVDLS
jgi:protein-tyrosine phosphatase